MDLPQPEGPTMTENMLSSTASDTVVERQHRGLVLGGEADGDVRESRSMLMARPQKSADQGSSRRRRNLKIMSVISPRMPMVKTPSRITSVKSPRIALRIM